MLVTFACAMLLLTASLYALRGGFTTPEGVRLAGIDLHGIGLGGISVVIAGWYFGPLYGVALVLAVLIHEYGHLAAHRVTGHGETPFRLVPFAAARGARGGPPASEAEEFFVAIAGPALSLGPMVLAFVLSEIVDPVSRPFANFLWIFAATTATLNFLNLLPLWPLDGGRCVRAIVQAFDRRAAILTALGMSAAFAAAAVAVQSPLLVIVALLGALTLGAAGRAAEARVPMSRRSAAVALGAYAFTAAAHFAGGLALLAYAL